MDDKRAIDAALECRWQDAISLNNKIIKSDPENVDALNRVAHAYFETGNLKLAKKYYTLALKFDQYNPIAAKNLKMLKAFKLNDGILNTPYNHVKVSPSLFLQEPGKTKVVTLLKVAEPQRLSHVSCGTMATLLPKGRGITVLDPGDEYLGVLPDDVAFSLLRFMKGGNKYEACVKAVKVNGLSIIIREIFRAPKFKNQPTFLEFSIISRDTTPIELQEASEPEMLDEEIETT